jgi:Protein of unknown function (DUF2442)
MSIGRIVSVSVTGQQTLDRQWDDGRRAKLELAAVSDAHPALGVLVDAEIFSAIALSSDEWSLEWPGGLDIGSAQLRRWADERASKPICAGLTKAHHSH